MWSSSAYLVQCRELRVRTGVLPIEPGKRIARGFADLGFEEFVILPAHKLLSIFTGSVTPLDEAEVRRHHFWVPSVDELVQELRTRGADCEALQFVEQRTWKCTGVCEGQPFESHGKSTQEALIAALLGICPQPLENGNSDRALSV